MFSKKRLFDVVFAGTAIVALSIPMAALYAATRSKHSRGIFKQTRLKKNGVPFTIYKFETMTQDVDDEGVLLSDEERITRLGRILRKRGLDELPQLFNVLKGEMSIVGPRPKAYPALNAEDDLPEEYLGILDVKPGLVGTRKYAQLNSNTLSVEDGWKMDLADAKAVPSLKQDFILVVKLLPKVLTGQNPQSRIRIFPKLN